MKIPDVIFSIGFDRALAWTMLHSIWQATLIAVLTGLLLFFLRHRPARFRYSVANLALLAVLLTSAGTFAYYFHSSQVFSGTNFEKKYPAAAAAPVSVVSTQATAMLNKVESTVASKTGVRTGFRAYLSAHLPQIVVLWFLGMAIFLCRLLGSFSRLYFLRHRMNFHADPYWLELLDKLAARSGFYTGVELLESALVRSPLTIGHWKPIILFPIGLINKLSEEEVAAILAHELAHILRRDYLFNILQSLVEAVFYFHPAIWWLSAQVRQERESACDDQAIALLGNKVTYAKALVSIQEMAFYPHHAAMAFAGPKRNQLLIRVQRLFSPPTTKFNLMEKWIATGLVICSLAVLAFGQHIRANTNHQAHISNKISKSHLQNSTETIAFPRNTGIWEATFSGDSVCMTFSSKSNDDNWVSGECFFKSNCTNLKVADGETAFQITRPAGTLSMTGQMENNGGYGRFEFRPDESYRTTLVQQGITDASDELMLHCFLANFSGSYLSFMKKQGYSTVTKEDLLQLAIFRMNEVAVRGYLDIAASMGKKNVPLHDLLQIKVANVSPETATQLAKAGYQDLAIDQLTSLSIHNLTPDYIDSMNAMGFGKLSVEDLITAKVQGINRDFATQFQNAGLDKMSFEDLVNLKVQGIDLNFIQQFEQAGLRKVSVENLTAAKVVGVEAVDVKQFKDLGFDLSFEDMVSAKVQGIDANFMASCQKMGLGNLSFEDITSIKIQGIDADFVQQCQHLGLGQLSFDDLISAKIHGITPAYVRQCQDMELGQLNFGDIMNMKIHGIDAAVIRQYHQMDIGPASLDNLMNVRIHNITPEFVKSFRDLHFENLSVDDLISARIHQMTPEFIKDANQKGYRFPSLQEYADLKLQGQLKARRAE